MTSSVPWRYRIGIVEREQAAALEGVRQAAYRAATEFDWNDEVSLGWTAADDRATVLAVWDVAGRMLSTVRATVLHSAGQAEDFLEYSLAGIDVGFPSLVLSRAATVPDAARQGLLAMLRHAYLSALATQNARVAGSGIGSAIRSSITIVYEGAPRLAGMRAAGYAFHAPRAGWDSEAVARTAPLLAMLPCERFALASRIIAEALGQRLDDVCAQRDAIVDAFREQVASGVARAPG